MAQRTHQLLLLAARRSRLLFLIVILIIVGQTTRAQEDPASAVTGEATSPPPPSFSDPSFNGDGNAQPDNTSVAPWQETPQDPVPPDLHNNNTPPSSEEPPPPDPVIVPPPISDTPSPSPSPWPQPPSQPPLPTTSPPPPPPPPSSSPSPTLSPDSSRSPAPIPKSPPVSPTQSETTLRVVSSASPGTTDFVSSSSLVSENSTTNNENHNAGMPSDIQAETDEPPQKFVVTMVIVGIAAVCLLGGVVMCFLRRSRRDLDELSTPLPSQLSFSAHAVPPATCITQRSSCATDSASNATTPASFHSNGRRQEQAQAPPQSHLLPPSPSHYSTLPGYAGDTSASRSSTTSIYSVRDRGSESVNSIDLGSHRHTYDSRLSSDTQHSHPTTVTSISVVRMSTDLYRFSRNSSTSSLHDDGDGEDYSGGVYGGYGGSVSFSFGESERDSMVDSGQEQQHQPQQLARSMGTTRGRLTTGDTDSASASVVARPPGKSGYHGLPPTSASPVVHINIDRQSFEL